MTTQINKKSLSLSILIALAGIVGCGPVVFELDGEELESRLSEAFAEAEGEIESDCDEGHDEDRPDAEAPTDERIAEVEERIAEVEERIADAEEQRAEDEERHAEELDPEAAERRAEVEEHIREIEEQREEDEERHAEELEEPAPCQIEIVDGMVVAPGETLEIKWDADKLYTSQVYVSVHSGWGAEYYVSIVAPNTGSFLWGLPADMDPKIDDYTVYVESAENGERTVECWDYADLLVVPVPVDEPNEEIEISPIPTPTPGPADLIDIVQEMAAQERCPVQGVLVGHFSEGEGMSNSFFHGKGFDQDGLAGKLKGQCTDAVEGDGFCKGVYASVSGNTGRLRTQYATLGANEIGAVGTFEGGWQADPVTSDIPEYEPADELKHGHLAGVWQESAEHQKGMFLGFWSACSE